MPYFTTRSGSTATALLTAACTSILLLCLSGCNNPELSTSLTQQLKSEFSIRKTPHIDSFGKYLELEDALFAELDGDIVENNPTGAEYALERYSRGSLADPTNRQPNWNRTFECAVANR